MPFPIMHVAALVGTLLLACVGFASIVLMFAYGAGCVVGLL